MTEASVFGTVARHEGPAVSGALVTLADMAGRKIGTAHTGADGSYRLNVPTGGTYLIIASAPDHEPIAALVAVAADAVRHDVTIAGVGGLTGTVRQAGTGRAVTDAVVTVTDVQGEVVGTGLTGPEGAFSFISLPEGAYTLVVAAPTHPPEAHPVTVRQGAQTRHDVTVRTRGRLRGEVRTGGEEPFAGATVALANPAGNTVATTVTEADGIFFFDDLSPGTYTVVAAGYGPAAVPVRIEGGRPAEVDVRLALS
jgi:uncharacterized surface anchored protein